MDETEDDARYPPNPYPQSNRRPFPSSNYSNHRARSNSYPLQIPREYPDDDGDEEERNEVGLALNDAEEEEDDDEVSAGRGHARSWNEVEEDDEEDDVDSSESRGKRRRLDRYARGFELVPRPAPAALKPLQSRSSLSDWSEDSTFSLLDVWGDLFLLNGRKSLRSDEWGEVAKRVSHSSKAPRSEAQCRNRLDTLKKKYKKEKAKYPDYASSSSKWIYFQKMDELISSPPPATPAARPHHQQPRLPCGMDAGEYVFANSRTYLNPSDGMDEMKDSPGDTASEGEGDEVDDESDGLPPMREKVGGSSESSFRMLADSIQKFGEIYEKLENSKKQHMAELERMRKEFHRDLELQKKQILDRAQAEIARIRRENGEGEEEARTDEDGNDDDDYIDVSAENMSG